MNTNTNMLDEKLIPAISVADEVQSALQMLKTISSTDEMEKAIRCLEAIRCGDIDFGSFHDHVAGSPWDRSYWRTYHFFSEGKKVFSFDEEVGELLFRLMAGVEEFVEGSFEDHWFCVFRELPEGMSVSDHHWKFDGHRWWLNS